MKFSSSLFLVSSGLFATAVSAFTAAPMTSSRSVAQQPQRMAPSAAASTTALGMQTMGMSDTIDASEMGQRDVYSMQQWATQCGAQTAEGVEITTNDGEDYFMVTNQNIPNGSPVLFVPAQMIISSKAVEDEFGGNLMSAENALMQHDQTAQRLPLFRLMVKVLAEYEKGSQSPWYAWLNSLPRRFYNGAAMTRKCGKKARCWL